MSNIKTPVVKSRFCMLGVVSVVTIAIVLSLASFSYRRDVGLLFKTNVLYSPWFHDKSSNTNATIKYLTFAPSAVPDIAEELFVKPKSERKYFIYDCSSGMCGGLGDRQEGILGAYILSQMLQRKFRLRMLIPCDIANHLQASRYDWTYKPSEVKGLSYSNYKRLDKDVWNLRNRIAKGLNLEAEFPKDVTYFLANQELVKFLMKHPSFGNLKWAQNRTAADLYNIVLRRLFKMTPSLQQIFNQYQTAARSQGRQLICTHIRMHGNPTIPGDGYFAEDPNARPTIWKFLKQYNNSKHYRIFVSTDSDQVRNEAKRLYPDVISDTGGNIIHVDRDKHSPQYACNGFAKVLLDQYTMSSCDVFLMADSGLGRVGAMLRGTDKGLFCRNGINIIKCNFTDTNFFPSYW